MPTYHGYRMLVDVFPCKYYPPHFSYVIIGCSYDSIPRSTTLPIMRIWAYYLSYAFPKGFVDLTFTLYL